MNAYSINFWSYIVHIGSYLFGKHKLCPVTAAVCVVIHIASQPYDESVLH